MVRTSRVVGGLGDEPLDGGRERLVRVVDEDVAGPDGGEDVGRLVLVGWDEARRRDRGPRLGAQLRVGRGRRSGTARSGRACPRSRSRRPASSPSPRRSRLRVAAGIVRSTSRRTASPNRRRRSSSSMAMSRSSASSSSTVKSALRVTRNRCASTTSMPVNRSRRLAAMTWSMGTNRWGSTSSRRGRIWGTLTRAKTRSPVSGSRRPTAIDRLSVEMYGNGWPGIDRERGQDREDLVVEALAERAAWCSGDRGVVDDRDAFGGEGAARSRRRSPNARRRGRGPARGLPPAARPACGRPGPGLRRRPRSAGAARRSGPGRTRRGSRRRWRRT